MLWTVNINVGDYGPVRLLAAGGIGGVRPRAQAQAQAMRAESCLCGRVMAGGCQLLCSPGSLQPLGGSLPCPRVQALRLELPCVAPRSCGFLYTRLWWEKGQNGAPALGWCGGGGWWCVWLWPDLHLSGHPQEPPGLFFFLLLLPPCSSLPSKASFSSF